MQKNYLSYDDRTALKMYEKNKKKIENIIHLFF